MKTYDVALYFSGFVTVEVDAESEDEALKEADRQYRDGELGEEMGGIDLERWEELDTIELRDIDN